MPPLSLLALSQAVPLLLLFWMHTGPAILFCLIAMDAGVGLFIYKDYIAL